MNQVVSERREFEEKVRKLKADNEDAQVQINKRQAKITLMEPQLAQKQQAIE